jgi:hypothetical protein
MSLTAATLLIASSAVAISVSAVSAAPQIRTGAVAAGVGFHAVALTPPTNIAPNPPYPSACQTSPTSATCQNAAIAALNNARGVVGLPAYALPANFQLLSAGNQFLVLSNLDRASYGLTQITGLNAVLNAAAAAGVATDSDPAGPSVVEGARFTAWTANWAAGWASPLYTYYEWMYDDGYPGANADCPTSTSPGCWGHRRSTLYDFGSSKVYMGAATGTSPQYRAPAFTQLVEGFQASVSTVDLLGTGAVAVKGPGSELIPGATIEIRAGDCSGAPVWRTTTGNASNAYGAFGIALAPGQYCAVTLAAPAPYGVAGNVVFQVEQRSGNWVTVWLPGPVNGALAAKNGNSGAINGVVALIRTGTCAAGGTGVWQNTTATGLWASGGFGISLLPGNYCATALSVPAAYTVPAPVDVVVTSPGPVWITLWLPPHP